MASLPEIICKELNKEFIPMTDSESQKCKAIIEKWKIKNGAGVSTTEKETRNEKTTIRQRQRLQNYFS